MMYGEKETCHIIMQPLGTDGRSTDGEKSETEQTSLMSAATTNIWLINGRAEASHHYDCLGKCSALLFK